MRIAICDDDSRLIENVKKHLKFYSAEKSVKFDVRTYTSGLELLASEEKTDIAILDVEMPEIDGIEVGKRLCEKNRRIILIYITAHSKYLDDALNLNAARFFEKPIDSKRFYKGLDNAIMRINDADISFYLADNEERIRVSKNEIIYVEIEPIGHRKTKVVTENKTYISSNRITFWENELPCKFFVKTHKSFIVNLDYLTKFNDTDIELDGRYTVPLSRSYKASFQNNFANYMAGV